MAERIDLAEPGKDPKDLIDINQLLIDRVSSQQL